MIGPNVPWIDETGARVRLPRDPREDYYTRPHERGWECPKCGSVYAPFVPSCTSCNRGNND